MAWVDVGEGVKRDQPWEVEKTVAEVKTRGSVYREEWVGGKY